MKLSIITAAFVAFITISSSLFAQDEVVLKMELKPELVYTGVTKNIMSSSMDFEGNDEMRQQIINSGTSLPMMMEGVQQISYKMTTAEAMESGDVPFEGEYFNVQNTQKVNGAEQPQQQSPLDGMHSYGRSVPGRSIEVDSIRGENLSPEIQTMALATVKAMLEGYKFPQDKKLKIGDTLVQTTPMSIPLGGYAQMDLKLILIYKLIKIENEQAFFDIDHQLELKADVKEMNMSATGGGAGSMIYDLKYEYAVDYNSDLKMELSAKMEAFDLVGTMNLTSNQQVTIERN